MARFAGAAVIAVPAAVLLLAPKAAYAQGLEQITRYQVAMSLNRDASMHVQETIDYDFGSGRRHGIYRVIPTEFHTDEENQVRVYPISDVEVTSPTHAPTDTKVDGGAVTSIRVGDPDKTVTGRQTYVMSYDVRGVINTFTDHQELYWNAIGTEWSVTISGASVTVKGPEPVQKVACFEGAQGSTQTCQSMIGQGGSATFVAPQLQPAQGMTVVASLPSGTFPDAAPIIKERQTLARAFSLTPLTGVGTVGIFALLAGGAGLLVSRRGRDERYLGVTPGLEPGLGQEVRTSRVAWLRRDPVAVQFTPPKDMRPGELGTLIDEQANVVDVTATIIDLAVRGFLRIEEVEAPGRFRSGDWKLVMIWPAKVEDLRDYELVLLKAIFEDRREVLLSTLKQHFRSDLQKVQSLLYDDVTHNGWFRGDPSAVRTRWQFLGVGLAAAGGALTWFLATRTRFGLLGVAVALGGLVMLFLAPRMPARTAKGTAVLSQAKGFRMYLERAEADQLRWEEGEDLFSRYLPYAIVFGVAERWAKVFARLAASGAAVATPTWYVSSNPAFYAGGFDYNGFSGSMDAFTSVTSGALAAATPSSSGGSGFGGGGFSGGGGGGGGGGSW